MLRIDPGAVAPVAAAGPRQRRLGGPGTRRGSYVGQRAFSNTTDTVHHFEWDGARWIYRGWWRIPVRQA